MKADALTVPRKEAAKDSVGIQNVAERIRRTTANGTAFTWKIIRTEAFMCI